MFCEYELDSYFDGEDECSSCCEQEKKLEAAAHYFEGVVEEIFSTDFLDANKLYDYLQEVGHVLGVKIPDQEIKLHRRRERIDFVDDWIAFNNQYMSKLTK